MIQYLDLILANILNEKTNIDIIAQYFDYKILVKLIDILKIKSWSTNSNNKD